MKKVMITLILTAVVLLTAVQSYAVSEASVLFLMISPGARAAGMGEAFVGLADDATAVFWNPAGLAYQQGRELTLMHANWLPQFGDDLFYDFLAYRQSFEGIGTLGVNATYLNLGKQIQTDEDSPDPIGEFSSYEYAISLTYGALIAENWSVGAGLRYIRSNLSPVSAGLQPGDGRANAVAFDLATLYKFPFAPNLSMGVNLSNMGPKITYVDAAQADPLPTNLKLGFAYKAVDSKYNRLTFVADMNKMMVHRYEDENGETQSDPFYKALFTSPWIIEETTENDQGEESSQSMFNGTLSGGVEYWYSDLIALRAGYYWDEPGKVDFVSFGAGIQYHLYRFDFGYISAGEGHPLSNTMRFSLTMGF